MSKESTGRLRCALALFHAACSFIRPSNWRDKFRKPSRRLCCVVKCASETPAAGGEATARHGGDASSSEITSSSAGISCFEGAQHNVCSVWRKNGCSLVPCSRGRAESIGFNHNTDNSEDKNLTEQAN